VFAISFPHLNGGAVQYAKKLAEEGKLGRLTSFRSRNVHNGCEWLPEHWYDLSKTCGGAMMDLGAHPNYLAAYFLGTPEKVTAVFSSVKCPEGMDDNAVAVIGFENKAIAVVETGFLTPHSAGFLELEGDEGALVVEGGVLRYKSRAEASDGWLTPELPEPLPPILRQWLDAIIHGKELPEKYGIDAAVNLSVMTEAEYISAREGRAVTL
jgi:predicted dehydrogenase